MCAFRFPGAISMGAMLALWPAIVSAAGPLDWPEITSECRPWAYHWWLGSAVDEANLTREFERYHQGGLGGVHVVPIYGAQGAESRYIEYLSPRWLEMLTFAVKNARSQGLGVDITTGTGWNFGGPNISRDLACRALVIKKLAFPPQGVLPDELSPQHITIQTILATGPDGQTQTLTDRLDADGKLSWSPPGEGWSLYVLGHRYIDRLVKRAAPGGEGPMLDAFYGKAMRTYLERFTQAFATSGISLPRAMYHDSYEYFGNWSPDLPAEFAKRRGYRIEDELPALAGEGPADRVARVRCDVSETLSDLIIENVFPQWIAWCHERGMLTRNQAHGAPSNWLDFYALADIPETEMFAHGGPDPLVSRFDEHVGKADRDPLICKFASSAAHTAGRRLTAAETGTWLAEHFCETFEELKCEVDLMLLSGVNHIFYHGCVYSPDDAAWPGWLFYASTEMNPRNPLWREAPALNDYVARCQAILQSGQPDNDVLLYWPIHDAWTDGVRDMSVHNAGPLHGATGVAARALWQRGYGFDYVSDRLLEGLRVDGGTLRGPGGATWQTIVVPLCNQMPPRTLATLARLAEQGAGVIFEDGIPADVPGLGRLAERRAALNAQRERLVPAGSSADDNQPLTILSARYGAGETWIDVTERVRTNVKGRRLSIRVDAPRPFPDPLRGTKKTLEVKYAYGDRQATRTAIDRTTLTIGPERDAPPRERRVGQGRIIVGNLDAALTLAGVHRETLVDHPGTMFIRRRAEQGRHYLLVNHDLKPLDAWLTLATPAKSVAVLDPLTGQGGAAQLRRSADGQAEVYVHINPGHSLILRTFEQQIDAGPTWRAALPGATVADITGPWQLKFIAGGPALPEPMTMSELKSWTTAGGTAEAFAGTARYTCRFDAPQAAKDSTTSLMLDLGDVKHLARVQLNGRPLGVLIMHPYCLPLPAGLLKAKDNQLEIEVTNLGANRIRDLDRRHVAWKIFHNANVMSIRGRALDATDWPVFDSGLLGPVRISVAVPPPGASAQSQ